ncbi:biotin--[acetyl-CoA-carboxylase] ligase (plasmid) [Lactiplantibacillus plantarum]|uniref:biotin--[acetyl-CoA-carboxylase] ligase n=1 Tax=Lactiplantibacillus plantarum TaxID=1590 RepID=UPI00338F6BFA
MSSNYLFEYDILDSTMIKATQIAKLGILNTFTVLSHSQTNGIGKYHRTFYSPSNQGLYMTICCQINSFQLKNNLQLVSILSAVEAYPVIQSLTVDKIKFKWVNDFFIGNKKIGGILCTVKTIKNKQYVFIGIGINIGDTYTYPCDDRNTIGSILNDKVNYRKLASEISSRIITRLNTELHLRYLISIYQEHLMFLNDSIDIKIGNDVISGIVLGINSIGQLILKNHSGTKIINSGEIITHRLKIY